MLSDEVSWWWFQEVGSFCVEDKKGGADIGLLVYKKNLMYFY